MKAEKTEKKIDAVEMMRKIRDKLSQKYLNDPAAEEEDLSHIRRKYGIKIKKEA